MKAILEFNLENEYDRYEYDMHKRCVEIFAAMEEFQIFLRRKYKHDDPKSEGHEEELEDIQDKFLEILEDNNIFL